MILFTAASDQYADIVLQSFEGHQYFDHILSRKQCLHIYQKQVFIKDLSILLGNRLLTDIIIVDNKIESYSSNLENGIPIISYYGQQGDYMLKKLSKYLLKLKDATDVRETILRDFYLEELAGLQKSHNASRIFESSEIRAVIKRARERHSSMLPPADNHAGLMMAGGDDDSSSGYEEEEEEEEVDEEFGMVSPLGNQYQKRFGESPAAAWP